MNFRSWLKSEHGTHSSVTAMHSCVCFRSSKIVKTNGWRSVFFGALSLIMLAGFSLMVSAQTAYYTTNGTEYDVIGSLPGDQVFPSVALSTNGGYVVWQDNATDGDGWGISARQLDGTLSGTLGTFRVNVVGSNDQQNAKVTMLNNGGAAFVWEGGKRGYQHIYARFMTPSNTWLSATDIAVSKGANFQTMADAATLKNGNVVVVYSSFNQASAASLLDIYCEILSPKGGVVKKEFLVNQYINSNQRTPAVAALPNGGFVVTWISEQQRQASPILGTNSPAYSVNSMVTPSVDVYARIFNSSGAAQTSEFMVNSNSSPCANPEVAAAADGSYLVAWSARDTVINSNGWDVCARSFSTNNTGGSIIFLNSNLTGNQYAPHLSALGLDYLAVWTSYGQDGSREGVYGRFVHSDGSLVGDEFRVNTTTASQQIHPAVATDGNNQFIAVWASFTGAANSFDLFAQRYINVNAVLQAMPAPFVYAPFTLSNNVYQPQIQISWAPLAGIAISNYEVYVDGGAVPMGIVTSNAWIMTADDGLTPSSTHSFQVAYVKAGSVRSPLSDSASGTAWSGLNWGGIPYEWMSNYFGSDINQWPQAGSQVGNGGMKLSQIFLTGGNPLDPATWLTTHLNRTSQGMFLTWNTQPGFRYQVQVTSDFVTWSNIGLPRFAAGYVDSINVGSGAGNFYRVVFLR